MLTTLQIVRADSDFIHIKGFMTHSIFANMAKLALRYESLRWGHKFTIRNRLLFYITRPIKDQIDRALGETS